MKKNLNVGFYLPVMIMFFMFPVKFLQAQWNAAEARIPGGGGTGL